VLSAITSQQTKPSTFKEFICEDKSGSEDLALAVGMRSDRENGFQNQHSLSGRSSPKVSGDPLETENGSRQMRVVQPKLSQFCIRISGSLAAVFGVFPDKSARPQLADKKRQDI